MSRRVDDWITSYLKYTDHSEPPLLYREWVAVALIAAALQRKCYLRWGTAGVFYPNMYIVLVGPSGKCRKGTAMGTGAGFLRELGIKLAAEAITREALIRELKNSTEYLQRSDGKIITHASLTIYSQELTVFLGYDNKQLIADLTDWFDCRDNWTYRTKNMGTDEIVGVWVNLIGATTPHLIQNALPQDAIGGGLASRIIFVFEEDKGKLVPAPFLSVTDEQLKKDLLADLEDIYTTNGMFLVTEEFVDEWVKWYTNQDKFPPFSDPNFAGYNSRRATHILKLCMILSVSEDCRTDDGTLKISKEILLRAIDLLERTEVKMPRTFMGRGSSQIAPVVYEICAWLVLRPNMRATYDEIFRAFYGDLGTVKALESAVDSMVQLQFARRLVTGRTTVVEVIPNNPLLKKLQ